jgi:hypothetical protein
MANENQNLEGKAKKGFFARLFGEIESVEMVSYDNLPFPMEPHYVIRTKSEDTKNYK